MSVNGEGKGSRQHWIIRLPEGDRDLENSRDRVELRKPGYKQDTSYLLLPSFLTLQVEHTAKRGIQGKR